MLYVLASLVLALLPPAKQRRVRPWKWIGRAQYDARVALTTRRPVRAAFLGYASQMMCA
jgi:hypothetical protein